MLTSYFRNNVLHLLLMPSLLACAFLNNASRAAGRPAAPRVAASIRMSADEYFLRWTRARAAGGRRRAARGPAEPRAADGVARTAAMWQPAGRPSRIEAVQLSVLARATVPILERYYLAISLLLQGRQRPPHAGRARAAVPADGAAHVDAVRAQFARVLRTCAVRQLRRPACARATCSAQAADGRLVFEPTMLEAVAPDAQLVLHEQIRNSILQVVHR